MKQLQGKLQQCKLVRLSWTQIADRVACKVRLSSHQRPVFGKQIFRIKWSNLLKVILNLHIFNSYNWARWQTGSGFSLPKNSLFFFSVTTQSIAFLLFHFVHFFTPEPIHSFHSIPPSAPLFLSLCLPLSVSLGLISMCSVCSVTL